MTASQAVAAALTGALPATLALPAVLAVLATALLVLNVATVVAYAVDERAARGGRRRVPERTLLVLGLLGGWPGAQLARHALRHKTRKVSFRRAHRATVVANLSVVVGVVALVTWLGR